MASTRPVPDAPTPAALPDLSGPCALPADAVASFRARGHAVVRGLASPAEVAAYRPALLEAGAKGRYDQRPLEERDTYGKAFVLSRRFARAAAELMGVDAVRIYHDQALFKEAGGGPTPWHQDQFYWPLDTPHTITLWMPLVPVTPEMGPMRFASGSHRLRSLGDFPIGDVSEAEFGRFVREKGLPVEGHGPFAPGDATFHAGWTLHSAPPNRSDRMREVMTIIYYADGARVGPLDHVNRRFDRDVWLAGCEEGALAAGPRNPVLYRRGAGQG